jgi:hypothetical protein
VPTTASTVQDTGNGTFAAGVPGGPALTGAVTTPWASILHHTLATGDSPLGRGARGPVPLHLVYEAPGVRLTPGDPVTWQLTLRPQS